MSRSSSFSLNMPPSFISHFSLSLFSLHVLSLFSPLILTPYSDSSNVLSPHTTCQYLLHLANLWFALSCQSIPPSPDKSREAQWWLICCVNRSFFKYVLPELLFSPPTLFYNICSLCWPVSSSLWLSRLCAVWFYLFPFFLYPHAFCLSDLGI